MTELEIALAGNLETFFESRSSKQNCVRNYCLPATSGAFWNESAGRSFLQLLTCVRRLQCCSSMLSINV
jgi:hypothetical protein